MCQFQSVESSQSSFNCMHEIVKSPWASVAFIAASLATLVIGTLATSGLFCGIGVTDANYLSYAMYGTSTLFFLIFVVKTIFQCQPSTPTNSPGTTSQV